MSGPPTYLDSVRRLNELHNRDRMNPAVDTAQQIIRAIDVLSIRQPVMIVTAGSIYLEWSAERDWLRVMVCDDVPMALVWKAWTQPEHIKKWFAPKPWTVADCEIDLRRGGIFRTVMRSPKGEEHDGPGCILDIVENQRLTWTSALAPGYRPLLASKGDMPFTATILLETVNSGTKYTVIAAHADESGKQNHEDMGFIDGWGTCLDQLVECIRTGAIV